MTITYKVLTKEEAEDKKYQKRIHVAGASFLTHHEDTVFHFNDSSDKEEYKRLHNGMIDVQISQAYSTDRGFVLIAEDDEITDENGENQCLFYTTVIPSNVSSFTEDFLGEVQVSNSGFKNTLTGIFNLVGPLLDHTDIEGNADYPFEENLAMICHTATHPDHLQQGIASGATGSLLAELESRGYVGVQTIGTSMRGNRALQSTLRELLPAESSDNVEICRSDDDNHVFCGVPLSGVDADPFAKHKQIASEVQPLNNMGISKHHAATFVTDYYFGNHEAIIQLYDSLDEDRKLALKDTFYRGMLDSFEVIQNNNGRFFMVLDEETQALKGFSMGMAYLPSVQPLSGEFFNYVGSTCQEFFGIFADSMPVVQKYGSITDEALTGALGDKEAFYVGMTAFLDDDVKENLARQASSVFNESTPKAVIYNLASAEFERDFIDAISDGADLIQHQFGEEGFSAQIRLVHTTNNESAFHMVDLFAALAGTEEVKEAQEVQNTPVGENTSLTSSLVSIGVFTIAEGGEEEEVTMTPNPSI